MPFLKRLGTLLGKCRNKERIGVGQRHHEQSRGRRLASNHHLGLTKVGLGLARRMYQWHKHLGLRFCFHRRPRHERCCDNRHSHAHHADVGRSARRCAVASWGRSIGFENLMDDRHKRIKLGPDRGCLIRKPSWFGLLKDLAQGLPMDGILDGTLVAC